MKTMAIVLLLAVAWPPVWWRESNSYRQAVSGAAAFAKGQYEEAARSYEEALAAAPSPRNAFNAGTASIAAGKRAEGSAQIEAAFADPSVRSDAYFNRGNSALEAGAFEHAAADYIAALRANPRHAAAKRNLEIALQRKRQQEEEQKSRQSETGDEGEQQPAPAASPDGQQAQKGEIDVEALLRSAQQQEQEELRRLKGQPAEGKVGW